MPFSLTSGLRQEDPLPPLLFNLALEYAISKTSSELTGGFANQESKLLLVFADDLDAVAHFTIDVLKVFSQLEEETGSMGLRINEENTKYMLVIKNPRPRVRHNIATNDHNFDVEKDFKYLGSGHHRWQPHKKKS
ncbi:uncharacterized protein [Diabrotica undecimpunctata]|uniref:uncharacterized protein n=1 Tax=Diabrotica undecimpunctata TaxID=50387 RepID=UPI003B636EA8